MTLESEDDLSGAIREATGPLRVQGGGTRDVGNPVTGEILAVRGLSGVTLYEPGSLTLVAKAGTSLADIEALLASEGQRLAFEPMDHRALLGTTGEPTIGGMVAANISGPRRIAVGACRDFLLGVRFVDGVGRVLKNGGRVMKNVTGYDLAKLMAGSWGTLGVLSEVSLKVLPLPEAANVLLIEGLSDGRAVEALSAALGSPYDVTGAAHVTEGLDGAPVTMLRLEGFDQSVSYRAARLREHLKDFGHAELETRPERILDGWKWLRDVASFCERPGDVWRLSVKPSDGPVAGMRLREKFGAKTIYDWGGGLVWALVPEGSDVRAALHGIAGHARIERASPETRSRLGAFSPDNGIAGRLEAGLRSKFDPKGIFNPGLMG